MSLCFIFLFSLNNCFSQVQDTVTIGNCGSSIESIFAYNDVFQKTLEAKKKKGLPPSYPYDIKFFTLQEDFPPSKIVRCGNFKLYFEDSLHPDTLIGFARSYNQLGYKRQGVLCDVLQYIQTVIQIGQSDTLDIYIARSWDVLNPSPVWYTTLASAGPFFPDTTFGKVQGIFPGNLFNHITKGVDPDADNYDAFIIVNFEKTYSSDPPGIIPWIYSGYDVFNFNRYDFYSVMLHECTHALGWYTGISEDTSSSHYLCPKTFLNGNSFSLFDSLFLFHRNILSTTSYEKFVVFNSNNLPIINPSLANLSGCLRENSVWLNNNNNSSNHPIYSGNLESSNPSNLGSLLSHLNLQPFSFPGMSQFLPGLRIHYVMGPNFYPGEFRNNWTLPELRTLNSLGYEFTSQFLNSTSINNVDLNMVVLDNTAPFRVNYNKMISSMQSISHFFPDTISADTSFINYNTISNPNLSFLTIDISSSNKYVDPENETIRIMSGTMFGIRGVSNNGNNHEQLSVNSDSTEISFCPQPDFSGRAQFGFHIWDRHEKGALIIYTIDVVDGCDSNSDENELIINGSFEDGTEVKRSINVEFQKPYTSLGLSDYYLGFEGEYFGGTHFSGAHPFLDLDLVYDINPGGDVVDKSYSLSTSLYPRFGHWNNGTRWTPGNIENNGYSGTQFCPLPLRFALDSNMRYHKLPYNKYSYNASKDSIQSSRKYVIQGDLCFPSIFFQQNTIFNLLVQFTSDPMNDATVNDIYQTNTIPIHIDSVTNISIPQGKWQHFCDTITYCGPKSKFLRLYNASNLVYIDNLSLKRIPLIDTVSLAITNNLNEICNGENVIISAIVSNYICAPSYIWSTGAITSSISVAPQISTTYKLTVTVGDVALIDSLTIIVHPLPAIQASFHLACESDTLFLFADGGTNYLWQGPDGYYSTLQNPIITPVTNSASGTYTVTVESEFGCQSEATIEIPRSIYLNSNSPICRYDDIKLYAENGTSFEWSGPNNFSSSSQNPIITNADTLATGWYVCTSNDPNLLCNTDSVWFQVYNCCSDSSLMILSNIAATSLSSPLPQRIAIAGEFTIDNDYELNQQWSQMYITMLPGSTINILKGANLEANSCNFGGCQELWNTINLEKDAGLTLNQCSITDAQFGVTANESPNLLIKNSHFHKNYIGLYYPEPEPWELLNSNNTFLFSGNEFDCENATLLYPLTGQKSYAGVCIYSLANADLFGADKNIFHHMDNGIVATNTNLTLHNAKFYNIPEDFLSKGVGVKIESYATPFFLLAKEAQGSMDTTFYNCGNCIYSKNMNNYVAFNRMVEVNYGINIEQSPYCNQTIQSNVIECQNWGVTLFENDPVNNVDISNNFIRINNPNSLTTTSRGITLMEFNNPPLEKCEIHNNLIFMDSASIGIYALVTNSTNIYNNVISMTKQNINNAGINTTYCLNNITHCNYIQGSYYGYVDTTAIKQNGIQVISSLDSKYSCNQMSNSVVGLKVQNSCLGDSIEGNEFYQPYIGLHYTNTAVTGEQRHKGNKWFGSFQNGYGAKHMETN